MIANSVGLESLSDIFRAELAELSGNSPEALSPVLHSIAVAAEHAIESCRSAAEHSAICQQAWTSAIAAQAEATTLAHRLIEIARFELIRGPHPARTPPLRTESDTAAESPTIMCHLFGDFELVIGGKPVDFRGLQGTRSFSILQYLAYHYRTLVSRDALIEAIWPEVNPDDGRRRLHQAIYALRLALSSACGNRLIIDFARGTYRLRSQTSLWIDVAEFEMLTEPVSGTNTHGVTAARLQDLRLAERMYRGDLLSGLEAEWVEPERDRLRRRYVKIASELAEHLHDIGEAAQAHDVWERVHQRDPWHEAATRGMMHSLLNLGQPSLALRVFADCAAQLDRDLGVQPARETVELYEKIVASTRDQVQAVRGPDRRVSAGRHSVSQRPQEAWSVSPS